TEYSNVDPADAGKDDNNCLIQTQVDNSMPIIEVVREDRLESGHSTPGAIRKRAFETENFVMSQTHLDPGVVSGWHHHGERDLYGFMIAGRLRLEYGKSGEEAVEVVPG